MSKFNNPLAPKLGRLNTKSSEIKRWVRELMNVSEDIPITVAELACRDEGCPDTETVIGLLEPGKPIVTIRIHTTVAEVTRPDVAKAAGIAV